MHMDHNALLSSLIDLCFTITSRVVHFLTLPLFECAFEPSLPLECAFEPSSHFKYTFKSHLPGSVYPNPTYFRVRL